MEKIAQRIKTFRTERGWTLEKMAEETGLSVSYIHQLEKGGREPSAQIWKLLELMERSPLYAPSKTGHLPTNATWDAAAFAERLKRAQGDMKSVDLAKAIKRSAGYISKLRSGRLEDPPSDATVVALGEILKVNPVWLKSGKGSADEPYDSELTRRVLDARERRVEEMGPDWGPLMPAMSKTRITPPDATYAGKELEDLPDIQDVEKIMDRISSTATDTIFSQPERIDLIRRMLENAERRLRSGE